MCQDKLTWPDRASVISGPQRAKDMPQQPAQFFFFFFFFCFLLLLLLSSLFKPEQLLGKRSLGWFSSGVECQVQGLAQDFHN